MSPRLNHVDVLFKVSTDFMNGKNFTFNKMNYSMTNGRLEAKKVGSDYEAYDDENDDVAPLED